MGNGSIKISHAIAAVAQHNTCAFAWHKRADIHLQPAVRRRCGEQQMAFAKLAIFTHIEEREFLAVV